jgi:septum site-determining protein MinC
MVMTMGEKPKTIQIKGIKEGLLVSLGEGEWSDLQEALLQHILENEGFFKGAKIALDVGNHILHAVELGSLRDKLSENNVGLWAVISNSPVTEQTAQMLGLGTRLSTPKSDRNVKPFDTTLSGENAVLVQRTLRSGFSINYNGHVVVIGDVNPGAEIIASGNIVIWGRLRGDVHAGCEGDEKAMICALAIEPTQLRIGTYTAGPSKKKNKPQPEIAFIREKQLVITEWKNKEGGR